jgi:predicted nucleotidyltransferase
MMNATRIEPKLHIDEVIRNAVVFNTKNWHGNSMNTDTLLENVARLFDLLHEREIAYLLVGGVALLQYVEGRNTQDIDLIMALSSLKKLPEIKIGRQDTNFAHGQLGELQVDILLTRNQLFEKVRRHYVTRRDLMEQEIPLATVEGLVLLKLYALPSLYRQGNFARVSLYENDIATLMYEYKTDIEPLMRELAGYLSETDIVALREIVAEIEERIRRFGKGMDMDQT